MKLESQLLNEKQKAEEKIRELLSLQDQLSKEEIEFQNVRGVKLTEFEIKVNEEKLKDNSKKVQEM